MAGLYGWTSSLLERTDKTIAALRQDARLQDPGIWPRKDISRSRTRDGSSQPFDARHKIPLTHARMN